MKQLTLPGWKTGLYMEVYQVTEYKDGCIWKTRRLGVYVPGNALVELGQEKRVKVPEGFGVLSQPMNEDLTKEQVIQVVESVEDILKVSNKQP